MNTWEGALKLLKILTVVFMLSGCSTQYSLLYKTNVMPNFKADKTDPLTFSLDPRPNGIHFTVQNNSDQTAKIIWDKSYFIMPDGNSFKALNADLLGEGYTTVIKAQYVSTIPSKSTFSRFTTAAYEVKYGNYWTISVTADVRPENNSNKENNEIKAMNALNSVSDNVGKNNNLGLGLVIEHQGIEKEYRFDIRITKIDAIKNG